MRYLTRMRRVENSRRPINLSGRTSRPGAPTTFRLLSTRVEGRLPVRTQEVLTVIEVTVSTIFFNQHGSNPFTDMKAAHLYPTVPHKPECNCLTCKLTRQVQSDAYGQGHQEGYLKGYREGLHKGATIPPDAETLKELTA